jgi:hypothetical protein
MSTTTHTQQTNTGRPRQVRAYPTVPSHVEECDSEQKYTSTGSSVGGYSGGEYRYQVSNLQKHPPSPPVRLRDGATDNSHGGSLYSDSNSYLDVYSRHNGQSTPHVQHHQRPTNLPLGQDQRPPSPAHLHQRPPSPAQVGGYDHQATWQAGKQYNARSYQDTSSCNNNNRSDVQPPRKLDLDLKSALPDRLGSPASLSSGGTHPIGPLDFTIGGSKNSSLHDILDAVDSENTGKNMNADGNVKAAPQRGESCQARAAQRGKPEPINSARLRAIRQKTRNVVVSSLTFY